MSIKMIAWCTRSLQLHCTVSGSVDVLSARNGADEPKRHTNPEVNGGFMATVHEQENLCEESTPHDRTVVGGGGRISSCS